MHHFLGRGLDPANPNGFLSGFAQHDTIPSTVKFVRIPIQDLTIPEKWI